MTTARIEVGGAVRAPRSFTRDELCALEEQVPDLSQEVPGRAGAGVRVGALLDACEPQEGATHGVLRSGDGRFEVQVELEELREGILAHSLEGGPFPEEKGGPLRFFVAGSHDCSTHEGEGCANVKDVAALELRIG